MAPTTLSQVAAEACESFFVGLPAELGLTGVTVAVRGMKLVGVLIGSDEN